MNVLPTDDVPGPPPGPGVRAPFAAPPTERDGRRMWIGLGIGLAVLVVCCGGGVFGFGALVYSQSKALPRQAVAVVDEFLRDLQNNQYIDAYDLLCTEDRSALSNYGFEDRQQSLGPVTGYQIGEPRVEQAQIFVPTVVTRPSGPDHTDFVLVQDQRAGGLRICGGE